MLAYSDVVVIKETLSDSTGISGSGQGVLITPGHVLVECSISDQADVEWITGENSYTANFYEPGTSTSKSVSCENARFIFGIPENA